MKGSKTGAGKKNNEAVRKPPSLFRSICLLDIEGRLYEHLHEI